MAKKNSPVSCGPDRKWEVEDALRTLNRAEEIRKDKRMMGDVAKLAKEQIDSLSKHVPAAQKAKPENKLMVSPKKR